jgi:thymidylate synthase (FAD)
MIKHRTISFNGESARYKEYRQDRWHVPDDWPQGLKDEFNARCEEQFQEYHDWLKYLASHGFTRARAKETARYLLPMALVTTYDMSMNFWAFVHFQKLRNSPHAQKEIREIAQQMLELVNTQTNDAFKWSLEAFGLTIPTTIQEAVQEGGS